MRKLSDLDYALMRFLKHRCGRSYAAIGRVVGKHRGTVYNCLRADEPRMDLENQLARMKW